MEFWILGAVFFFMGYAMLSILDDIRDELRQLRGRLADSDSHRGTHSSTNREKKDHERTT